VLASASRRPEARYIMLVVPFSCLPEDDTERALCLERSFRDHRAHSARTPDGWAISLSTPDDAEFYIDPRLDEGLRWWGPSARVSDIPRAVRRMKGFQLSLADSWCLLSWSEWLARRSTFPEQAVLLHVDSHSDLIAPHLWQTADGWLDPLTGKRVDAAVPSTVADAIGSGAVDIATYIVPLAHALPELHVRYLRPTVPRVDYLGRYSLEPITVPDLLLAPDRSRLKLSYSLVDAAPCAASETRAATLRVSNAVDDWLADLPDAPLLLHIDCDYFNNRHDVNNLGQPSSAIHDPAAAEVEDRIEALFDGLESHRLSERIEDVCVALSPKYFPAELWALATERLERNVARLGTAPARGRHESA
jgi:hypothetical protein